MDRGFSNSTSHTRWQTSYSISAKSVFSSFSRFFKHFQPSTTKLHTLFFFQIVCMFDQIWMKVAKKLIWRWLIIEKWDRWDELSRIPLSNNCFISKTLDSWKINQYRTHIQDRLTKWVHAIFQISMKKCIDKKNKKRVHQLAQCTPFFWLRGRKKKMNGDSLKHISKSVLH